MRIGGLQNKFELFQAFYYDINGVEISYNEAVKMFYNMDEATQTCFVQYCADRVEYQIAGNSDLDLAYITGPSGYNLDKDMSKKYVLSLIAEDYSIQAYAAKNGLVLDSQWNQFSAKEIIQMANDGVNIPQEIVDIAHTIMQSETPNLDGAEGERTEGNVNESEKTEKETFLELIPKAKKNIDKCHDKENKIDEKITQLIQDNGGIQKSFEEKMEKQKDALKEYEQMIREWRVLQNKINNGEELTDTEASKYAQITGMLEDKNGSAADFKLDKLSIARNLNEINILAVLGEQLADETIEIGDQLADYTSEANYKTTGSQLTGEMGFLRTIIAMLNGKTLAKEANEVGHETKDYTEDTADSIADIAGLLGVEKMIENPATQPEGGISEDVKVTEEKQEAEGPEAQENLAPTENEEETADAAEEENDSVEEDFIINDENILNLIDEGIQINNDLLKQIDIAAENVEMSDDDIAFAKSSEKIVSQVVDQFKKEEDERQKEIAEKQEEIDRAQAKIEELGGGEENEENEENPNQDEIDGQQAIVDANTADIETINNESKAGAEKVKTETAEYKERINKSVPEEDKALKNDTKYRDEIIPAAKEHMAFTLSSGKTLYKMGTYRVKVGQEQISLLFSPEYKKGLRNIERGTISQGIGKNAVQLAELPIADMAEKITEVSTTNEDEAINSLTEIDNKIIEITGDESASAGISNEEDEAVNGEENGEENANGENGENAENAADGAPKTIEQPAPQKSPVAHISVGRASKVKSAPKSRKDIIKDAKAEDAKANSELDENGNVPVDKLPKRKKKKDKNEGITDPDKAGDAARDIGHDAKDSARDSEKVKNDADKDTKQLDKETKKLQKKMKKDEKDIIRMTKESIKAAKKQEEILKRYEELTKENDAIAAEEASKKANAPAQAQSQGAAVQGVQQDGMAGATNSFGLTDSSKSTSAENAKKMEDNNQEITLLSGQFTVAGNKITRNRAKIVKLQKATKKNVKTVNKKSKIKNEKIKEAEQKEMDKQKRLAKQLATVGIAENVFSITLATGEIMLLSPWTHAAGVILVGIGTDGLILCGLTKATINLANGNLTGALIGLGQTAVSVVGAMSGAGAGATNVLQAVSAGLSVVSSSAQLVNNIRTLQGKEADGALSMIGTIAGVASSVTSAGAGLMGTKNVKTGETFGSAFSQASSLGKIAQIANIAGTAVSSVGQLMSEFGGDEGLANILSTIGGGISLAASVTQLAAKKGNMESENKENTEQVQQSDDAQNPAENKKQEKPNEQKQPAENAPTTTETSTTETSTTENTQTPEMTKEQKAQAKAEAKAQEKAKKAQDRENLEVAKSEVANKKAAAEKANVNREGRKNMKEYGASEKYANYTDEQLDQQIQKLENSDGQDKSLLNDLRIEKSDRKVYQARKQIVDTNKAQKNERVGKIFDGVGQAMNTTMQVIGMFSGDDTDEGKKTKNKGYYDAKYLRNNRYLATVASNDSYFGGGHNDDQKRRFKKFAKRI